MVCLQILLSIVLLAQATVVKTHTWFSDPERAARLQTRWNNYKAISHKNETTVAAVCGKFGLDTCSKLIGRPSDQETESCDKYCCHAGKLTGFCQTKGQGTIGANSQRSHGEMKYKSSVKGHSYCRCTNDLINAKCGPDGSVLGIRCPDRSACSRKCCREGRSGGSCGGFLRLKCECD